MHINEIDRILDEHGVGAAAEAAVDALVMDAALNGDRYDGFGNEVAERFYGATTDDEYWRIIREVEMVYGESRMVVRRRLWDIRKGRTTA